MPRSLDALGQTQPIGPAQLAGTAPATTQPQLASPVLPNYRITNPNPQPSDGAVGQSGVGITPAPRSSTTVPPTYGIHLPPLPNPGDGAIGPDGNGIPAATSTPAGSSYTPPTYSIHLPPPPNPGDGAIGPDGNGISPPSTGGVDPMPNPPLPINTGIVPPHYLGPPAVNPNTGSLGYQPGPSTGYQPGQSLADYTANAGTGGIPPAQYGSGQVISDFMNQFTNPNSAYIQQARQAGLEQSASRGGLNGSIAAGNAQREAIKAAQPLVSEASTLLRSREGYAAQNWMNSQQFDREFNGALATLPITSSLNILQSLAEAATTNPEVYTPDIISGYSNFFAQNMQDILSQYFHTGG